MIMEMTKFVMMMMLQLLLHLTGYGFAIGNVAAFDMSNKDSIVSPGGVGFDINCGVRCPPFMLSPSLSLFLFVHWSVYV